jgi:GTPase SAR1 family protein
MVSSYYKNVDGIMIVFDYGNVKSYYDIKRWLKEINMFISDEEEQENVVIYLIGNKVDLQNEGNKAYMGIDEKDMKVFANNNGVKLYNVSALRNVGVYQVFRKIVEDVLKVREKKSKLNKYMLLNGNMGLGKGGAMLMERESTFKEDEMGKGVSMEIENYNNNTNNMNSSSNNNSMCVIN